MFLDAYNQKIKVGDHIALNYYNFFKKGFCGKILATEIVYNDDKIKYYKLIYQFYEQSGGEPKYKVTLTSINGIFSGLVRKAKPINWKAQGF